MGLLRRPTPGEISGGRTIGPARRAGRAFARIRNLLAASPPFPQFIGRPHRRRVLPVVAHRTVQASALTGPNHTSLGRLQSGRAVVCGYGLAGQAGVSNPPSPTVSGALPTSRGIRPEIGPPLAAEAGVVSVWLTPSLAVPTQRRGVMPWTCAAAGLAGSSAIPLATASATSRVLDRCRGVLRFAIAPTSLLDGWPTGVTTCRPEGSLGHQGGVAVGSARWQELFEVMG